MTVTWYVHGLGVASSIVERVDDSSDVFVVCVIMCEYHSAIFAGGVLWWYANGSLRAVCMLLAVCVVQAARLHNCNQHNVKCYHLHAGLCQQVQSSLKPGGLHSCLWPCPRVLDLTPCSWPMQSSAWVHQPLLAAQQVVMGPGCCSSPVHAWLRHIHDWSECRSHDQ